MAFDLYINKRKVERKLSCIAEVARISPAAKEGQRNYDVGIAFTEITQDERAVIIRFVRQKNIKEAKELRKMYYALKDMVCRLTVLEESHPTAEHFRKVINHAIEELDSVAYILDSEIDELRSLGQEADG